MQFDHQQDELERIANTPWEKFKFQDLMYYYHDLAYVELQGDLFRYLFPICLMDWHVTLQNNQSCYHGDADFHYGVREGKVFERMLTPKQRQQVYEFLRDSFLDRLDRERGLEYRAAQTPAYGWMARFNSAATIVPQIALLWDAWWSLESPGQAVAALQYVSGLMYFDGENPFFGPWTPDEGGGGRCLWRDDTQIGEAGWLPENVEYLKSVLTVDFVGAKVDAAVERLRDEPEYARVLPVSESLRDRQELIASRIEELPTHLLRPGDDSWIV